MLIASIPQIRQASQIEAALTSLRESRQPRLSSFPLLVPRGFCYGEVLQNTDQGLSYNPEKEELGRLPSTRLQRVGHDCSDLIRT